VLVLSSMCEIPSVAGGDTPPARRRRTAGRLSRRVPGR
jgi:hypothetical protein